MPVIPFYGSERPDLFAIERRGMDPAGKVIAAIDRLLPADGVVLDVGAGDGFTAERLRRRSRVIVAVEPAEGMRRPERHRPYVGGDAAHLPFRSSALDGMYATWAYYFAGSWDLTPAIAELDRVVRPGGPLVVVDNLGDDEFTSPRPSGADVDVWASHGFGCEAIDTTFEFDSLDDARTLMRLYFGDDAGPIQLSYSYRVGVFSRASGGPHSGSDS